MVKLTNDAVQIVHSFLPDNHEHLFGEWLQRMFRSVEHGDNQRTVCASRHYDLNMYVSWHHGVVPPWRWLRDLEDAGRHVTDGEAIRHVQRYKASAYPLLETVEILWRGHGTATTSIYLADCGHIPLLEIAHKVYEHMPAVVTEWTRHWNLETCVYDRCETEVATPHVYRIPSLKTLQDMANFRYIQTNLHRYWTLPSKQAPRPTPTLRQVTIRNYFRE